MGGGEREGGRVTLKRLALCHMRRTAQRTRRKKNYFLRLKSNSNLESSNAANCNVIPEIPGRGGGSGGGETVKSGDIGVQDIGRKRRNET